MSFHALQFRMEVIRPALVSINKWSRAAEDLLMGTAAVESKLGTYLVQLSNGPAKGVFQMEPATHDDIWDNFLSFRPELVQDILSSLGLVWRPGASRMVWDLRYAAIMARMHYLRVPEKLPSSVRGQAEYWKKYYNTALGDGQPSHYVAAWATYVNPTDK